MLSLNNYLNDWRNLSHLSYKQMLEVEVEVLLHKICEGENKES